MNDQPRIGLTIYLAGWAPLAGLTVVLLHTGGLSWLESLLAGFPVGMLFAFVGRSAGYLCRTLPLAQTGRLRLAATLLAAALVSSACWLLLGRLWIELVADWGFGADLRRLYLEQTPSLFVMGTAFYLLAVAAYYLTLAFEKSRQAEHRALELELLARQAELRALQFQINPHFLFNSLNSISALTRSDPEGARRMCLLLARFFRRSLSFGGEEKIPLNQELELVRDYLEIEKIRFSNLQTGYDVHPQALNCMVPSLLLQPLVENAVKHGSSRLPEGGTIRLRAEASDGRLRISVENPCDPDAPARRGAGLGLKTVEQRLENHYPRKASLKTINERERFRVELSMPVEPEGDLTQSRKSRKGTQKESGIRSQESGRGGRGNPPS